MTALAAVSVNSGRLIAGSAPLRPPAADPIVLVAHGSRDPRAAAATHSLARAVGGARPGVEVHAAFLDHGPPGPGDLLRALEAAGHRRVTLVPLLLTAAYHGRVDIPGAIAAARAAGLRMPVRVTDVLGPATGAVDPLLLSALRRRLSGAATDFDAVVLAAAGTRDAAARTTVDRVAAVLGAALDVPCLAAYASAAVPTAGDAVARLTAAGARRVAVAAYFLAPGRLYEVAAESARAAGAIAVARPLADAPEIARLVLSRVGFDRFPSIAAPVSASISAPVSGASPAPVSGSASAPVPGPIPTPASRVRVPIRSIKGIRSHLHDLIAPIGP